MDLDEAYAYAGEVMAEISGRGTANEGIDAFLDKREPNWRGC